MEKEPNESINARESLLKIVSESYREEYKRIIDNWNRLEGKSQGSVAIGGIFIAGALAYLHDKTPVIHFYQKFLLGASIACLLSAVIFSILALRIRDVAVPPMGEYLDKLVCDLLERSKSESDLLGRIPAIVEDQITQWREVNIRLVELNFLKAKNVWIGQIFLVSAIFIVGILVISTIIS